MFLFQLISVLFISVTFYTYLANIFFSCATWPLSVQLFLVICQVNVVVDVCFIV